MAATFSIPFQDSPDAAWPIALRLLKSHDELRMLDDNIAAGWTLAFVLRHSDRWVRDNRQILGTCSMPGGDMLKWLLEEHIGYCPTFLITLDADWWLGADEERREILLFHEMLHCGHAVDAEGTPKYHPVTGEPVPCMQAHDLEEFDAVVERYGAWKGDVASFLAAAGRHRRTPTVATRREAATAAAEPEPAMF